MQIYFIRHAQSTNNVLWEETGYNEGRHEDPEVTDLGRRQIAMISQFLAQGSDTLPLTYDAQIQNVDGFNFTHLYSSLMVRAMDTACGIGKALGLTPVARDDLHEAGGVWLKNHETDERVGLPGLTKAELQVRYPNFILPNNLNGDGWWNRPMETMDECYDRAQNLLQDLRENHDDDAKIALVSHGMFYNVFMRVLLKMPRKRDMWFSINNVAITRFDFGTYADFEESGRLGYHNRVDFLPPEMIS